MSGTQLVYGDGWDDIKVRLAILYNFYGFNKLQIFIANKSCFNLPLTIK